MRILIETVPHSQQRYDTCGDWVIDADGTWHIRVSQMPAGPGSRTAFALLVGIHELIEMALCQKNGVTEKDVDDFDLHYVGNRDEPGDDIEAPYYREHQIAAGIERILAAELGVDWAEYEAVINALGENDDVEATD
jgi:hypothetical protein